MPYMRCSMIYGHVSPSLYITEKAIKSIAVEGLVSNDGLETGGILLGRDESGSITICQAGGPGPQAKRGPKRFDRDLEHAQKLADAAWKQHGWQWLGEWHTHPSGQLAPSELDLTSYLRHIQDPELNFKHFVSVIVRIGSAERFEAAAWVIDRRQAQLVPLVVA
jgi:integrative and conjugative element protein (TIGR02256 family)